MVRHVLLLSSWTSTKFFWFFLTFLWKTDTISIFLNCQLILTIFKPSLNLFTDFVPFCLVFCTCSKLKLNAKKQLELWLTNSWWTISLPGDGEIMPVFRIFLSWLLFPDLSSLKSFFFLSQTFMLTQSKMKLFTYFDIHV